jgi:hypothetical protein
MMPEMTGLALYERLASERPDVARRVVFMTGGTFGTGVQEFLDRLPNPCIDKPFGVSDLRRVVGAV